MKLSAAWLASRVFEKFCALHLDIKHGIRHDGLLVRASLLPNTHTGPLAPAGANLKRVPPTPPSWPSPRGPEVTTGTSLQSNSAHFGLVRCLPTTPRHTTPRHTSCLKEKTKLRKILKDQGRQSATFWRHSVCRPRMWSSKWLHACADRSLRESQSQCR